MKTSIDKYLTGLRLAKHGLRVPVSQVIGKHADINQIRVSFPCILKPKDEGSSISLYKIRTPLELAEIIMTELVARDEMLLQEFVR